MSSVQNPSRVQLPTNQLERDLAHAHAVASTLVASGSPPDWPTIQTLDSGLFGLPAGTDLQVWVLSERAPAQPTINRAAAIIMVVANLRYRAMWWHQNAWAGSTTPGFRLCQGWQVQQWGSYTQVATQVAHYLHPEAAERLAAALRHEELSLGKLVAALW